MRALPVALLTLVTSTAAADDAAKLRGELIAAINKRDVAGVKSRITLPLQVLNLAFTAPDCAKLTGRVSITEAELPALVGCLADLGVKSLDGPDDHFINAIYGPGFPLILANAPVVKMYGMWKPGSDVFTIEPRTFVSHMEKFTREIEPPAPMKKALDAASDHVVADLMMCVDAAGKVKPTVKVRDEAAEAYVVEVEKVARAWSVKRFLVAGKPIAACARLTVGYPFARISAFELNVPPPPPPPPPPPGAGEHPNNISPAVLEVSRISGNKQIIPDDKTKTAMQTAGVDRVAASFKLCVSTAGAVTSVTVLKPSGFPDYDTKITGEMHHWAYRPYLVDGKAVPVCTAVTFIYSQK